MATTPPTKDVEAGLPAASRETESSTNALPPGNRPLKAPAEEMPPARHLLVTLVICFLVTFGLATVIAPRSWSGDPRQDVRWDVDQVDRVDRVAVVVVATDESSFARLLNAVSPDSLHAALHRYFPGYQHGVYASDHEALEAVHRVNAALATSLANLAKRQDGGSNDTTARPPPPRDTTTTTAPPPPPPTDPPPPPPDNTNTLSSSSSSPPPPPPTSTETTTTTSGSSSTSDGPTSHSSSPSGRITTTTRSGKSACPHPRLESRLVLFSEAALLTRLRHKQTSAAVPNVP